MRRFSEDVSFARWDFGNWNREKPSPVTPGDVGAEDFPEEEGGDDAREHGVGEVEVV